MAEPGLQVQGILAPNPPPPLANQPEPQAPQQPAQQVLYLNWSFFKPESSGKHEEDAEAHLFCTNDWDECTLLYRRCQGPEILSHIVRRG